MALEYDRDDDCYFLGVLYGYISTRCKMFHSKIT